MKSDLVDIDAHIHAETTQAVLISDDGEREHAVWLPKKQIEIERRTKTLAVVTLPHWLAFEKELI
ncbi:MAG: hypothetical protein AAAB35_10360 [Phyllobacterium sp.]|uniref:hypothetical protein n=1 Tax=Phyllobacterium sp. TaxID=1871046 RepID=UPI0030F28D32